MAALSSAFSGMSLKARAAPAAAPKVRACASAAAFARPARAALRVLSREGFCGNAAARATRARTGR